MALVPRFLRHRGWPAAVLTVGLVLAACSGSDDSTESPTPSEPRPATLSILVTNDDGFGSAGIDALANELQGLPEVTVTVVAPETNQSGTSTNTSPGLPKATSRSTASGAPATAVLGFPADSVRYGLDEVLDEAPDLVIAGINEGQNVSTLTEISGTVGAAREAAGRGIPAIAVSQGLGEPPEGGEPDYASAAEIVAGWITSHRDELADGSASAVVLNVNVPTCVAGAVRGVVQVPLAPDLEGLVFTSIDCTSPQVEDPTTDIAAFNAGFASATTLEPDGLETTSTTRWTSR